MRQELGGRMNQLREAHRFAVAALRVTCALPQLDRPIFQELIAMPPLTTRLAFPTLTLLLASHAALASTATLDPETPRRIVRYADLDIGHAAGAAALYKRIKMAAREVCEPQFNPWQQGFSHETSTCRHDAIERAVSDVNAPTLTSYHLMKSRPDGDHR